MCKVHMCRVSLVHGRYIKTDEDRLSLRHERRVAKCAFDGVCRQYRGVVGFT